MPETVPAHQMSVWYDHRDLTRAFDTPGARNVHDSVQSALSKIFSALYVDPVELFVCDQDRQVLVDVMFDEARRGFCPLPDLRLTEALKSTLRVVNYTTGSGVDVYTWPWLSQGVAVLRGDYRRHCFPSNGRCCHA